MRSRIGLLLASALSSTACGSAPTPLAPRAPEYEPDQQTKSRVRANPLEPLVVEWPAAARARLEAQARRGIVAVRYDGTTMEVLGDCTVEGRYAYSGTNVHRDRLVIRTADELAAQLPLGVASLRGKLEQAGRLEVSLTVVGAYVLEGALDGMQVGDSGLCRRATHFVAALTAGAFELSSGAAGAASIGGGVGPIAGADASHRESREVINRAGDETACAASRTDDMAPPPGCGALLRVELAPIRRPPAASPPVVAAAPTAASEAAEPPMPPPSEPRNEAMAPREDPPEPAPIAPSRIEPARSSQGLGTWAYVGLGAAALVVAGLVVAGAIVGGNQDPPARGPQPTGGLGSVKLSHPGIVRW